MIDFNSLSPELLELANNLWEMDCFMFERAPSEIFHKWEKEGFCFANKVRADLVKLAADPDELIRIYELWKEMAKPLVPAQNTK